MRGMNPECPPGFASPAGQQHHAVPAPAAPGRPQPHNRLLSPQRPLLALPRGEGEAAWPCGPMLWHAVLRCDKLPAAPQCCWACPCPVSPGLQVRVSAGNRPALCLPRGPRQVVMLTVIKRRSVAGNGDAEIQRVKVGALCGCGDGIIVLVGGGGAGSSKPADQLPFSWFNWFCLAPCCPPCSPALLSHITLPHCSPKSPSRIALPPCSPTQLSQNRCPALLSHPHCCPRTCAGGQAVPGGPGGQRAAEEEQVHGPARLGGQVHQPLPHHAGGCGVVVWGYPPVPHHAGGHGAGHPAHGLGSHRWAWGRAVGAWLEAAPGCSHSKGNLPV